MIPEEVAEIAYMLREYYDAPSNSDPHEYSIDIAWKIHNLQQDYNKIHLEGSY